VVPDRAERADGAVEQRRHHAGLANTAVGLQGTWGNFFIGQWTTPWSDLESLWSIGSVGGYSPSLSIIGRRETTGTAPNPNCVNGHLSGSPLGVGICDAVESSSEPFWRRFSQAVFYYTPVFGGAQAKFAYQTNEGKATSGAIATSADPQAWSASIQWSGMGGKARIGAAFDAHKDYTVVGEDDTGWTVKGGYDFGFVDVGLAYEAMEYAFPGGGDRKQAQWGIALAIPVGQGAIRASYSVADDSETPAGEINNGAKEYTIGYDMRLSKRTQVGFGYAQIKNDPGAIFTWTGAPPNQGGASNNPVPGSDPSTFFVSVIHRF
jgi:predicted porin